MTMYYVVLRAARARLLEDVQPPLGLVLVLHGDQRGVVRQTGRQLRIRVPYWATRGVEVRVNGQPAPGEARPTSYFTVTRTWKTGDRVQVNLPMSLHVHPMPDDETLGAIMYGPLVLAGELGTEGLTWDMLYGDPKEPVENHFLRGDPVPAPEFRAASSDPASVIRPAEEGPPVFRTVGQSKNIRLVPLNSLFDQRYAVYWRLRRG